jgi:hypothetical protein
MIGSRHDNIAEWSSPPSFQLIETRRHDHHSRQAASSGSSSAGSRGSIEPAIAAIF